MDQHQTQRTRFLERFFDNLEGGTTPDLESYLHDYPEIQEFVRSEFAAHVHDQPPPLGDPGRYVVEAPLARGGMGELYIARDQRLDRQVVLKSVPPGWQTANTIRRLQREARALGRVDHPSICPILDLFELDGSWTIVLPLLHGQTLAHCIEVSRSATPHPPCTVLPDANPSAPLPRLLEWITLACQAVAAVHREGIIHRDLKPGNLFLRDDGTPIVLDFGLALDETDADQRLTLSGDQVGTPLYMAPEQVDGKTCDARTDVYALGVILYETLALTHPFEGTTRAETFRKILAGNPPPLRSINPSIPRDLAAVCHKAIERLPAHRYKGAGEFASDLRRVVQLEPTQARPDSGVRRIARHVRRRPGRSSIVILLILAALTLSVQQIVEARVRAQTIKAERQRNEIAATTNWENYEDARRLRNWDDAHSTLARYSEAATLDAPIGMHLRINAAIEFFNYFANPTIALALLDTTIAHLQTCSPWGETDRMSIVRQGITLGARPLAGSREDLLGWALERRGYIRMHNDALAEAVADLEQSLPLLTSTGNKHRWTNAIHELGEACFRLGDPRGETLLEQAKAEYAKPQFGGEWQPPDTYAQPSADLNGAHAIDLLKSRLDLERGRYLAAQTGFLAFMQNWAQHEDPLAGSVSTVNNHFAHALLWYVECLLWSSEALDALGHAPRTWLGWIDTAYGTDAPDRVVAHRDYVHLVMDYQARGEAQTALVAGQWLAHRPAIRDLFDLTRFEDEVLQRASQQTVYVQLIQTAEGHLARRRGIIAPVTTLPLPVDKDLATLGADLATWLGEDNSHPTRFLVVEGGLPKDICRSLDELGWQVVLHLAECVVQ